MTLEDTPVSEMAFILGVDPTTLSRRLDRMIGRLKIDVPSPRAT